MSKRNFILLIIILSLVAILTFGLFYFKKGSPFPGAVSAGTNFISQFNPFAATPTPAPVNTPTDPSGYQPNPPVDTTNQKFKKVSSMPVAGFGLFSKERLKDVGTPIPTVTTPTATGTSTSTTTTSKTTATKPTPPPTEFVSAVRYVDKATGNIYQTFA